MSGSAGEFPGPSGRARQQEAHLASERTTIGMRQRLAGRLAGWRLPWRRGHEAGEGASQRGSIATNLLLISAAWLVLALLATAFLLTDLYSRALDQSLVEILDFDLETLVARSIDAGDPAGLDVGVIDPRFTRPASGWYWAIRDPAGLVVNASDSLAGIVLPQLDHAFDANRTRTGIIHDGFGTRVRVIERQITMGGKTYDFEITGSLDEILGLVDNFRGQALIVLGAVGLMLAVMSFIAARLALRPVGRLRRALELIREGEQERVEGSFPREIAPLAVEVNELLRSNAQIVERARNQVGNLAHGLKTPLAVLRNEAADEKSHLARTVSSEAEKMLALVTTYLDRARLAARTAVVGKRADPTIVMLRLVRVMKKLNPSRDIEFRRPDASLPWFRGEEGDFEEMIGNLLDNACKWSKSRVMVSMLADRRPGSVMLVVRVEDDGPGLTAEQMKAVMRRGVRLDEQTPGSGLGLDIVKELVAVYGGSLDLHPSALGGLMAELHLPSARVGRA